MAGQFKLLRWFNFLLDLIVMTDPLTKCWETQCGSPPPANPAINSCCGTIMAGQCLAGSVQQSNKGLTCWPTIMPSPNPSGGGGSSIPLIVGGTIAGLVLLLFLLFFIMWLMR